MRLLDRSVLRGYLNPGKLGSTETIELLTPDGEQRSFAVKEVRSIYFVREFSDDFEPERKAFLSRPKLDGFWVRLKFRDNDTIEGVVPTTCFPFSIAACKLLRPICTERPQDLHSAHGAHGDDRPRSCRNRAPKGRCAASAGALQRLATVFQQ